MATTSPGIFVSYRRGDTAAHAGRLFDRLADHYGEPRVFMDVDSIGLGLDFVHVLQEAVSSCEVMLVLIGPGWVQPRLDDPEDYVRVEIETALDRGIRVVPILVGGATLPDPSELPEPLKPLVRRQALELGDATFRSDAGLLIERLDQVVTRGDAAPRPAPPAPAAASGSAGDRVLAAFASLRDSKDVFMAPDIPADRLQSARAAAAVPHDEEILVLVNMSVFGHKDAILFGTRGMYYRHMNHPAKTFGSSYEGLGDVGVAKDSLFDKKIRVGTQELTVAGINFKASQLVAAIKSI
jgi:hypothetical protein